jgi:DNA-directed RNA polymerase specialized sigma24 family protein
MSPDADFLNLPTHWSALRRAAGADIAARQAELHRLLHYYLPAVRAYLGGCCRDDRDLTDELVQMFAVQFLAGAFRHASRDRGSFRHYLKRSLSNLAARELAARARDRRRRAGQSVSDLPADEAEADARFTGELVGTILDRAWAALRAEQAESAAPYFDCPKAAAESPGAGSDELAARIAAATGAPCSPDRFRKILARARHKLATHIYEQVAAGLYDPMPEAVAAELAELGLLPYCAAIVARQTGGTRPG